MGFFDKFRKKKEVDPDVEQAEKEAYEREAVTLKLRRKEKAIEEAKERGRQKAHGVTPSNKTAAKVGKSILGAGGKLMELGRYGASLNWGGEMPSAPAQAQRTQRTSGKKKPQRGQKKKPVQQQPRDALSQFEMPEFPF